MPIAIGLFRPRDTSVYPIRAWLAKKDEKVTVLITITITITS